MIHTSEESSPARRFADRTEAQSEAIRINNKPRSGVARIQFCGAWDSWIIEVQPRGKPYGNPAVLRADGTIAKYA